MKTTDLYLLIGWNTPLPIPDPYDMIQNVFTIVVTSECEKIFNEILQLGPEIAHIPFIPHFDFLIKSNWSKTIFAHE